MQFKDGFAKTWLLRFSEERMGCARLTTSTQQIFHHHDSMVNIAEDQLL